MNKLEEFRKNQPLFWMNEVSGSMERIVKKFFNKEKLNPSELNILKGYMIQWVEKTVNNMKFLVTETEFQHYLETGVPKDYKKKIQELNQKEIMDYIETDLLEYGFDPF